LSITGNAPQARSWKTQIDNYRKRYPNRNVKEWKTDDAELSEVVDTYEEVLHGSGYIDFEDMAVNGLSLLTDVDWIRECVSAKFPIIAVDEYQDLGVALHDIVLTLRRSGCRLLAVGDIDQSIYGFNEVDPKLLLALANEPGIEHIRLRFNYRNGKNILNASLAALGEHRDYVSTSKSDGVIFFHDCPNGVGEQANTACDLAADILKRKAARNLGQIAVIYRDRFVGDVVAGACFSHSISYIRLDAGAAYPKMPLTRFLEDCAVWCSQQYSTRTLSAADLISDWLSFVRELEGRRARESAQQALLDFLFDWKNVDGMLSRWLDDFRNRLGEAFLLRLPSMCDQLEVFAKFIETANQGDLKDFTVARFAGQADDPDHLRLITFHSAKGLEFDAVIMLGLDEGAIPSYLSKTPEKLKEDRQLFYVGLTRARHEVHLVYSGFTENKGFKFRKGRSRFVNEVETRLQQVNEH
jgi:DNA helicase II / ATP-dependent DNA helicase PcrA